MIAAAVTAIPSTVAAVLSYRAVMHGRAVTAKTNEVSIKADENQESLQRIEHATNGQLSARIRDAVRDVLLENPSNLAEMRQLFDAMLYGLQQNDTISDSDNTIRKDSDMRMMVTVNRKEWGMRELVPSKTAERSLSVITEANVHHSDTAAPDNHAHCADSVRSIDNFHHDVRGWAGIAYNRIICPHGYVYWCRPLLVIPAAAEGHNTQIIAYCFLSNGNEKATTAAWKAFLELLQHDEERLNRKLKLNTHREVEPPGYTECPGDGIEMQVKRERSK